MPICSQYSAQDSVSLNFLKVILTSASLVLICLHFLFLLSFLQSVLVPACFIISPEKALAKMVSAHSYLGLCSAFPIFAMAE